VASATGSATAAASSLSDIVFHRGCRTHLVGHLVEGFAGLLLLRAYGGGAEQGCAHQGCASGADVKADRAALEQPPLRLVRRLAYDAVGGQDIKI